METIYIVRNNSGSDGIYRYNGEYKTLCSGESVELPTRPTSTTVNLVISYYQKVAVKKTAKNKNEGE